MIIEVEVYRIIIMMASIFGFGVYIGFLLTKYMYRRWVMKNEKRERD